MLCSRDCFTLFEADTRSCNISISVIKNCELVTCSTLQVNWYHDMYYEMTSLFPHFRCYPAGSSDQIHCHVEMLAAILGRFPYLSFIFLKILIGYWKKILLNYRLLNKPISTLCQTFHEKLGYFTCIQIMYSQ